MVFLTVEKPKYLMHIALQALQQVWESPNIKVGTYINSLNPRYNVKLVSDFALSKDAFPNAITAYCNYCHFRSFQLL